MNFKVQVFLLKELYGLKHVTRTDSKLYSMSRLIMSENYSFNSHTVHSTLNAEQNFAALLLTACVFRNLVVSDSEHSNKLYIL